MLIRTTKYNRWWKLSNLLSLLICFSSSLFPLSEQELTHDTNIGFDFCQKQLLNKSKYREISMSIEYWYCAITRIEMRCVQLIDNDSAFGFDVDWHAIHRCWSKWFLSNIRINECLWVIGTWADVALTEAIGFCGVIGFIGKQSNKIFGFNGFEHHWTALAIEICKCQYCLRNECYATLRFGLLGQIFNKSTQSGLAILAVARCWMMSAEECNESLLAIVAFRAILY